MKNNSDYNYLIKIFSEEKIKFRYSFTLQKAKNYLKSLEINDYIKINESILSEVIIDYFSDIERLKDFHNIEKVNYIKVASYLSYWIIRRKPLQYYNIPEDKILNEKHYLRRMLVEINELFAYNIIISTVFDLREVTVIDKRIWNEYTNNIVYHFVYRLITPQNIELFIQSLCVNPIYKRLS